jgi:hypothetical protein
MTRTAKMQRALESRDRWLGTSWERAGLAKAKDTPECEVRLDRVEVNAAEIATEQIPDIPGFLKIDDHFLNRKDPKDFLPYRRIANYESEGSIQQMDILYEPTCQWISPFKVTLIPRDVTGLQPPDALSILELLTGAKIVRMEVAFDFGYQSGVDAEWIRSHSLFGKARRNQLESRRGWDCWGSRKGAKFIRSYYKKELGIHRVELQLNRRFLNRFEIRDIFDFHRLTAILLGKHFWFAKIDEAKMRHHLRMTGHWGREYRQILERVADGTGDLCEQCSALRKRGKLKNVRRVLVAKAENALAQKALRNWAAQWPKAANRLEVKP